MVVPVSEPVPCTTSSMSRTICSKSAVASGWNTMADLPVLVRPSCISSVTCAVVIANTRSVGAACLIWRLPRRTSRKPMDSRLRGALQLRLEALQRGDPLLHRRVRRKEAADAADRRGEELLQLAGRAQVLLRDLLYAAGDLHQRGGEGARAARDQRGSAVGGELAVAREGLHQEEGDDVHRERDEEQDEEARVVVVVAVARAAAEEEAELDDVGGDG